CVRRSVRFRSSREEAMKAQRGRVAWFAGAAVRAVTVAGRAQEHGGVLKIQHMDNPPSASIHEEATVSVPAAFMSVYNNLVLFDQHVAKNSLQSIVPELATKWEWQDGHTKLVFTTREGVKWHDGKPFTAKDVGCTSICC